MTYDAFVDFPKPPHLAANVPKKGCSALRTDIRRSRFNALVQDEHELCVFSPVDEPTPAREGVLGDFSWIDLGPPDGRRKPLSFLPFRGPAWYFRLAPRRWQWKRAGFLTDTQRNNLQRSESLGSGWSTWISCGRKFDCLSLEPIIPRSEEAVTPRL